MVPIPESHTYLLNSTALAHLGTINPDGSPQVTPLWFNHEDGYILINSAKNRRKDRNMRARPEVGLSIVDPNDAYRYLGIQGKVVEITEEGADDHIHALSRKYQGKDYTLNPNDTRVTYKIEPIRVWTMG